MWLIHTADIHLDASYAWAAERGPGFGARRRKALRMVVQRIMRRAAEWPADAVLIAGDLFDLDRIEWDTVAFLREMFELARPVPVFMAPGESDPYTPESPYASETWPDNVHIFQEPRWDAVQIPERSLTVHGFAFDGPRISRNPFGELRPEDDGRTHVAVAHGAERDHLAPGAQEAAPFALREALPDGLHYLALGHFHEVTTLPTRGRALAAYSGAPEGQGFDAPGQHYYLELEGDCSHGFEMTPVPSSATLYEVHTLDCSEMEGPAAVAGAVQALAGDGPPKALRVRLKGAAPEGLAERLDHLRDEAAGRFEYLELIDETQPGGGLDALLRQATSLGAFLARMEQEMADAPDDVRRRALRRTRDLGWAAFRGETLPLPRASEAEEGEG